MTSVASNNASIVYADEWNRGNPLRRCTGKSSRTGKRCRRWAIRGGNVCPTHGGSLKAVKRKAKERLEQAADRMAKELLGIATSADSEAVRLAAVKDALDRAGLGAKAEVEIGIKPFERIFEQMEHTTRAEFRRSQGIEDDSQGIVELPPVDVEVDVVEADGTMLLAHNDNDSEPLDVEEDWLEPNTPDERDLEPDDLGPLAPQRTPTPEVSMMSMEAAVSAAAAMRAQRALPRGR